MRVFSWQSGVRLIFFLLARWVPQPICIFLPLFSEAFCVDQGPSGSATCLLWLSLSRYSVSACASRLHILLSVIILLISEYEMHNALATGRFGTVSAQLGHATSLFERDLEFCQILSLSIRFLFCSPFISDFVLICAFWQQGRWLSTFQCHRLPSVSLAQLAVRFSNFNGRLFCDLVYWKRGIASPMITTGD